MNDVNAKTEVIAEVCTVLSGRGSSDAAAILEKRYPFAPERVTRRRFRPLEYSRGFIRDGFVDRYTGQRLLFPPVLRLLSWAMPERFPYHPNWKTDVTHPAYWEIGATIDHLVPVTRGGLDEPANWMTTSMARNSAKMNWTLDELGWTLRSPGNFSDWDGMLRWSIDYTASHSREPGFPRVRQWVTAGATAMSELKAGGDDTSAV
jgi:hypothetical protein